MEKINRSIKGLFFFSLFLSICLPFGVLGIVFGATKGITALLVVGIVCAVLGFYGTPIAWIGYGTRRTHRRLLKMIVESHIYTLDELAEQMNQTKDQTAKMVTYLILKEYLVDYLFKGDTLVLNTNQKQTQKTSETKRCSSCGAQMKYSGLTFVCDYCGTTEKK